ncbi:MAG: hypothetical protein KDA86_13540 [Planctomycetaceae bacterium]|nr:hypothetical protein [Planctomycetaceae bacterium]
MEVLLRAAAVLSVMFAILVIGMAVRTLRLTTLVIAWRWALGATLVWMFALSWSFAAPDREALQDLLWYAVSLISLCPGIAVLGARRPGSAAWTWFVVLPMLAVLGWPMLTVLGGDNRVASVQLEIPQLIGFVLVLLMGSGNYIGTKFWSSSCMYAVAVCLLVAPLSTMAPEGLSDVRARQLAGLILGAAVAIAVVQGRRSSSHPSPLDRLWDDFRNSFGIVWANRLQERVNSVARQKSWPLELTPFGILWSEPLTDHDRHEASVKLEETLRWLLRRFVDPSWIDDRLKSSGNFSVPAVAQPETTSIQEG